MTRLCVAGAARPPVLLYILLRGPDRGLRAPGHLVRGLVQHRPEENRTEEERVTAMHPAPELPTQLILTEEHPPDNLQIHISCYSHKLHEGCNYPADSRTPGHLSLGQCAPSPGVQPNLVPAK